MSRMARIYSAETMPQAERVATAGGNVAVFSAVDPTKSTPNEDSALVVERADGALVLAVADGGGGAPDGDKASALAVQSLRDSLQGDVPLRGAILDGVERANLAVQAVGGGAFTTLSIAAICEGQIQTYHVGDSGILVVGQRGKIKLQTIAHSPVGYAVEAGLLDEDDALHHDERHLVSNVLGSSEMRLELGSAIGLRARDRVLLASDGLFDNLQVTQIVDTVRCGPLQRAVDRLASDCHARMRREPPVTVSKPDDLTLLLFQR